MPVNPSVDVIVPLALMLPEAVTCPNVIPLVDGLYLNPASVSIPCAPDAPSTNVIKPDSLVESFEVAFINVAVVAVVAVVAQVVPQRFEQSVCLLSVLVFV